MRTVQAVTRSRALIVLATLALALTACDSTVHGNPTPGTTTSAGTSSAAPSTGSTPFAGLNPCTVIDQVMAGQGYPPAEPSAADRNRSCASNKPGDANVGVALQDGEAYDQNIPDPTKASRGKVGDRPAIIEREPIGAVGQCSITMEVKPNSRALVSLSGNGTTEDACDRVKQIAVKVEQLLPKSS